MNPSPSLRKAIALKYGGSGAPRVVATGRGEVAERIAAKARDAGVAVREDPALAHALDSLDLGQEIPEALYHAVAEVLVWAYALERAASD